MSTSPLSSTFKLESPNKASNASNTHPYAIKSSSSAILTRNNSVSNSTNHHHYVPLPHGVEPIKNVGHKKRRYVPSRKLNKVEAINESAVPDGDSVLIPTPPISVRVRRRDTLPASFVDSSRPDDVLKDLPINPKLWSPLQLATYLSSVLRLRDGAKLPPLVMCDVTAFVVKHRLDGRIFLKMTQKDYDTYDINQLWKEALINANTTLRQSLLQGQVFGSLRGSALSAEDLSLLRETESENNITASPTTPGAYIPWNKKRTLGRLQAGRVKGMAHKFERSYSEGETDLVHTQKGGDDEDKSDSDSDYISSIASSPVERSDTSFFPEDAGIASFPSPGDKTVSYEEEPTVKELVQDEDQSSARWGARAWEDEERNITARKITREDGPAQEILSGMAEKKRPLPETLASLFPDFVSEDDNNKVERSDRVVEDTMRSTDISDNNSVPLDPTSPFREVFNDNDIDTSSPDVRPLSMPSPSVDPLSGFSSSSSDPSDSSPMPVESFVLTPAQQEARPLKIDASAMTETTELKQSLHEVLQVLRDRVAVVEKRLVELETLDTKKAYRTNGSMTEENSLGGNVKPNNASTLDRSVTSATKPSSRPYTKRDVVGENIDRRQTPNYPSSDLNIYSYVFYASIGLAAMIIDRTIFGRGRA